MTTINFEGTEAPQYTFFVTCPKGLESLLEQELNQLGGLNLRSTVAGIQAQGDLAFAYRACLWSRLGNKLLLALGRCGAASAEELYQGIGGIDWSLHMRPESTLWIDVVGTNNGLRNSQFSAQTVKDAIVDQFRQATGLRPSIDREQPDLIVNIRIKGAQAVINLDLAGDSLHKRGYRLQSVTAPLKENLAAALLLRAGWSATMEQGLPLIDPMCGSGSILIEAAMMAADIAPGLERQQFAFERWKQHQPNLWERVKADAMQRRQVGLAKAQPEIRGYDQDPRAVAASKQNAEAAGVDGFIRVMVKPLAEFVRPTHGNFDRGLLITNPPYGERLGEQQSLLPLYGQLGDTLKREFSGWEVGVFTGNPELGKSLGLRSHKRYKLFNGAIASELLLFSVFDIAKRKNFNCDADVNGDVDVDGDGDGDTNGDTNGNKQTKRKPGLSDGAQMVANRLRKNQKQLRTWLKGRASKTNCYRVYDADLPEYSAAIDVYGDKIHIQEYQAPKSVEVQKAQQRLSEIVAAVQVVFTVGLDAVSVKQRLRQKGTQQYERIEDSNEGGEFVVEEGKARFYVNLHSYLDTGLFLDHRLVRENLAELAFGKAFLNLFCYTATATVHAALGGAKSSVSVDMSHTYLQWARKNFELNNVSKQHQLVQADCLQWLKECRQGFDLIFLDPPSFSNSKRMSDVLDVQRDHVSLIKRCMELLNKGGRLVFSTNMRKFKLDNEALAKYSVEDITVETIDKDFQRNTKIHQCFVIKLPNTHN